MKKLIKKFQSTSHQNNLWQKNSKIVLGVSGGPDSVCLLDIFANLQRAYDLELIIAHVNYGLRGKDSEHDEKFVTDLAKKYNIQLEILRPEIKSENNLENNLRDIRYDFFKKIRQQNNFDSIAVAHNLDDQAETFLMRIIRGSGLAGLSAMKFKNDKLIRPLLSTTRKEILEYLKENKLKHRTDRTNKMNLFFRNRVRNKLIPFLEKNFNPNIKNTIFDATLNIAEDYSLLESITKKSCGRSKKLSVKKLIALHPALQKRVLLQIIAEAKTDLKNIESSHIEEILKALKSTKGKNQIVVFKGLKMTRKGDKVTISYN